MEMYETVNLGDKFLPEKWNAAFMIMPDTFLVLDVKIIHYLVTLKVTVKVTVTVTMKVKVKMAVKVVTWEKGQSKIWGFDAGRILLNYVKGNNL